MSCTTPPSRKGSRSMKRRTIRQLLMLTALVLLLGESRARADFVDYSYHWSVLPSSVLASGSGSVTIATAADGTATGELGSSTPVVIPGATVTTTSAADGNTPDIF